MAHRKDAAICSEKCAGKVRPPRTYNSEVAKQRRTKRLAQPGYRERENAVANARATTIRRWLDDYKVSHGCVDCGFNKHPVALDFDHVRGGKTINVCNAKSIAQAKREIAKCEVRCSNCHRIKTHERRHPSTAS